MRSVLTLTLGLLAGLSAVAQTSIRMIVHEESKPCRRMMEQTCLQVQKDGSSEWELFYDNIKGFNFEEGNRYEIIVTRTERPEPVPQDLSKYLYKLDRIVSQTPVTLKTGSTEQGEYLPEQEMWRVVSLNGLQLNTEELYFGFQDGDSRIAGKSACNQFGMPVTVSASRKKIRTQKAISTMMACSAEDMKLESDFLNAVSDKKFRTHMKDGKMLWKKGFKTVLVLEPFAYMREMIVDPAPLAGVVDVTERTGWDYFNGKNLKVIQLNGKSVNDSKAHFVFENKRFRGNNGCNQITGNYESDGKTLRFTNVASTKMACLDETVQAMEKSIQSILSKDKLTVDFAEQVMNVYDASGALVMMLAVDESK